MAKAYTVTVAQTRKAKRLTVTDGAGCGEGGSPYRCRCGSRVMRDTSDYTGERQVFCLASHQKIA